MISNPVTALLVPFVGAASGSLLKEVFGFLTEYRVRKRVKNALASEIRAIIKATEILRLSDQTIAWREKFEDGCEFKIQEHIVSAPEFDPIFKSMTEKIGLLNEELSAEVVCFHRIMRTHRVAFSRFQGEIIRQETHPDFLQALSTLEEGIAYLKIGEALANKLAPVR